MLGPVIGGIIAAIVMIVIVIVLLIIFTRLDTTTYVNIPSQCSSVPGGEEEEVNQ